MCHNEVIMCHDEVIMCHDEVIVCHIILPFPHSLVPWPYLQCCIGSKACMPTSHVGKSQIWLCVTTTVSG